MLAADTPNTTSAIEDLYTSKSAVVGIIGLGYVGMPLAAAAWTAGFRVVGFDVDARKVEALNAGTSYLRHLSDEVIADAISKKLFCASINFDDLGATDA